MNENDTRYTPRAVNRRAYLWIFVCVLAAALCFAVSRFLPTYKGVGQILMMMLLVVAIFIASKYVFVSYTYIITKGSEETPAYFLIEGRQGKRTSLICQLPLRYIVSILPWDKRTCPAGRFSSFTASMQGGVYQVLHAREAGQDSVVRIEADEAFLSALATAIREAKE